MKVLGVHSLTHDVGAALAVDGEIVFAVEEERLSREKHHRGLLRGGTPPRRSIEEILRCFNLRTEDLDIVVHVGWPGTTRDALDIARWNLREFARELDPTNKRTQYLDHHQAHACQAFYWSPFGEAIALIIDGHGDYTATSLYRCRSDGLERLEEYGVEQSIGMLVTNAARVLGLGGLGEGEGKLTALASYGSPLEEFANLINFYGDHYTINKKLRDRFNDFARFENDSIQQRHKDFAASIQHSVVQCVWKLIEVAKQKNPGLPVCLGGGVALNCALAGRLRQYLGPHFFVPPAPNDAGLCVGAALYGAQLLGDTPRCFQSPYLGLPICGEPLKAILSRYNLNARRSENIGKDIATLLLQNETVALGTGRSEFGPRALGNRSLLARADSVSLRDQLNRIKRREAWRPIAPAINRNAADKLGIQPEGLNTMTTAISVEEVFARHLPGATHVDLTARLQVVPESPSVLQSVLTYLEAQNGTGAVLNTSMNGRGEPLCSSADDIIRFFYTSPTKHLALEEWIISK